MYRTLVGLAVCFTLSCPPCALAQAVEDPRAQASAQFRLGVARYQAASYAEALAAFEAAYALAPNFHVLYNIGQTRLSLADYLGAARSYERYLAEGGAEIPAARRAQVEHTLETLGAHVGGLVIKSDRADIEVWIDDVLVGVTPIPEPLPANAGARNVLGRAPDGTRVERTVEVPSAGVVAVELSFTPPPPLAVHVTHEPAREPAWSALRVTAVVSFTLGAGALAAGLTTGVLALRAEADDRKPLTTSTAVLGGAGGALVLTGILAWLLDKPAGSEPAPPALVGVASDGVSFHTRLAF